MRRTSKRTRTTYAGRVVYDRKTHYFKVKDVIRIAKKADPSSSTPTLIRELMMANAALIAASYGQLFANSAQQMLTLYEIFDGIRQLVGLVGGQAVFFGIDVWKEFFKWIGSNFGLFKPKGEKE